MTEETLYYSAQFKNVERNDTHLGVMREGMCQKGVKPKERHSKPFPVIGNTEYDDYRLESDETEVQLGNTQKKLHIISQENTGEIYIKMANGNLVFFC